MENFFFCDLVKAAEKPFLKAFQATQKSELR